MTVARTRIHLQNLPTIEEASPRDRREHRTRARDSADGDTDQERDEEAHNDEPERTKPHPPKRRTSGKTSDRHDERRRDQRDDDHADELDEERPQRLENRSVFAEVSPDGATGKQADRNAVMNLHGGRDISLARPAAATKNHR